MSTQPWGRADLRELSSVRGICLDIDDTLSTDGKLTDEAYRALWDLHRAGFAVVPVTGRPAGWCDHFARFWPVDAIIGENGAFAFYMEGGVRRRLDTPGSRPDARVLLQGLEAKIRSRFPHAVWASDQPYRDFDLAIDICEDVPRWNDVDVQALLSLCQAEGAHAKLSSIHVNTWFGDYDKRKGMEAWLGRGAPGLKCGPGLRVPRLPEWGEWLFIGDSPNDEPMFAAFPFSVGVANLAQYLPKLTHPPRWITSQESGRGFVEMAKSLILSKNSSP